MSHVLKKFKRRALALSIALASAPVWALPALQLDIAGGTYDSSTQTIMGSSNSFSLYAYGLAGSAPLADFYYVSMTLLGVGQAGGSVGSFKVNGNTYTATGDMTWGTPPLEAGLATWDPGDLSSHGIFPAYFKEFKFKFSSTQQSGLYNTQDHAGWGPQAGTGMYSSKFDVDVSGLQAGLSLHFDLYNEKFKQGADIDVNKFAPFSHDAQVNVTTPVPEPETYAMMLAGLGLLGVVARRRKQKSAS